MLIALAVIVVLLVAVVVLLVGVARRRRDERQNPPVEPGFGLRAGDDVTRESDIRDTATGRGANTGLNF